MMTQRTLGSCLRGSAGPAVLAGILLLALGGCLFDTRDPEQGTGEVCYESVPSTEEDFVLANMDGSLRCLQASTYLDQLADDFTYVPDPQSLAAFGDVYASNDPWELVAEERFLDRLFADADSIQSHLLDSIIEQSGTQIVQIQALYRVRVVSGGSAIVYSGQARYTLRQEATTWFMVEWEDQGGDNPFGLLRGGLLQGG